MTSQIITGLDEIDYVELCFYPDVFKKENKCSFKISLTECPMDYSKLEEKVITKLKELIDLETTDSLIKTSIKKLNKKDIVIFNDMKLVRTNEILKEEDLKGKKLYIFNNERNPLLDDSSENIDNSAINILSSIFGTTQNIRPIQAGETVLFTIPINTTQSSNEFLSLFQNRLSSLLNIPVQTTLSTDILNIDLFNNQSRVQEDALIRYETQLKELHTLGFVDDTLNIEALIVNDGNLELAIEFILNGMG